MAIVEFSDAETVAIVAETFADGLATLGDTDRQVAVLQRIHTLLDSPAPERYIYETVTGTDELQVIRVGGDLRVFCRFVTDIPANEAQYNVLFLFSVEAHEYRTAALARFDSAAAERLSEVSSFDLVDDLEAYLEDQDALTATDIAARIERLES